jgi:hypothetical protein
MVRVSPFLWMTASTTAVQVIMLAWGFVKLGALQQFCRAVSSSGTHNVLRAILHCIIYAFVPVTIVSITFSWVSYYWNWPAGYFFVWFPFLVPFLFALVAVVTENDFSATIDEHRQIRSKLPAQPMPPPLVIVPAVEAPAGYGAPDLLEYRDATVRSPARQVQFLGMDPPRAAGLTPNRAPPMGRPLPRPVLDEGFATVSSPPRSPVLPMRDVGRTTAFAL